MLHRFEIHSTLNELSRTALLCCRLAASHLCRAACWQLACGLVVFLCSLNSIEIGQYIYTIHIPEDFQVLMGFLPFTWANWSVYGLHKWYAKLRTGKFCAETTQKSHVPFTFQPDFLESFCKW